MQIGISARQILNSRLSLATRHSLDLEEKEMDVGKANILQPRHLRRPLEEPEFFSSPNSLIGDFFFVATRIRN